MKNLLLLGLLLISYGTFSCTQTLRMTDTYGDGWNGGTVSVSVNGTIVLNNVGGTFTSGVGPVDLTFSANAGDVIRVYLTAGGTYPSEMRVSILDNSNNVILASQLPVTGTATTGGATVNAVCLAPMTVTSSTITQIGTGNVQRCMSNVPVICLNVVTGTGSTINLTQIQANLSGTAAASAFSNCRIYYTGSTNTFSTTTTFGTAIPTVATFSVNGSSTLNTGNNYFWICLDLNNTAVIGSTVDMICSQFTANAITITSSSSPNITVTNPAGSMTTVMCLAPGGVNSGLQTWLRADLGTVGSPNLSAWNNQVSTGTATNLNGTPAINTTNTSYNYNPYVDFAAPVGTLDGGIAANRQCILLNGYTNLDGIDYKSLFFAFQLNDLTRVNTHIATVRGVTTGSPANGTLHGDADAAGTTAAILLEAYDITDFGTSAPAGTWQRNGSNLASNSNHSNLKHILSANCTTGGSTTLNTFLGGQNDLFPSTSFAAHVRDWKGPAAEVIGFTNSLTLAERQRVDSYIAIKYGITLSHDYLATTGSTIYTTAAPYNTNIIGIGRDDAELLNQKQSHDDNDLVRIYRGSLAAMNASNTSTFSSDISYIVMGDNNGAHCTTTAALSEMPTGLTNCLLYSRLEKEWKVQRTNMTETYNMDVALAACGNPSSVNVADLRLLVDDDGNFANGGTQCYYIGDGTGINFSYTNPYITVQNISTTHIPNNSTKFITIASVNVATPLPVELLSFDAKLNTTERKVDLTWSTQSEINADYFEVQKLVDNEWDYLDYVDAKGNPSIISHYATVDYNPILGNNYYRLKQVDNNGSFVYSDIRVVNIGESYSFISIFPNPANNSFQVVFEDIAKQKIEINDATGRKIQFDYTVNSNNSLNIISSDLADGYYTIRIIGEQVVTERFIIKH